MVSARDECCHGGQRPFPLDDLHELGVVKSGTFLANRSATPNFVVYGIWFLFQP